MPSSYQVYRDRVNFKGKGVREYVETKTLESIDDLVYNSQYGTVISIENKDYNVAILSTSLSQEYEAVQVLARSGFLDKGRVFDWDSNKWLIVKTKFNALQAGFNGTAYKCTGYLNWLDESETLKSQPAYIRSGRITNALGVTPDKNERYSNLILHDTDWNMMAATPRNLELHPEMRFIIQGQAYRVTNVDNVSIDNVSIISLIDDKLLDSDDLVNSIAYVTNYKLRYSIEGPLQIAVGESQKAPVQVLYNGTLVDEQIVLTTDSKRVVSLEDNMIKGLEPGTVEVIGLLAKNPNIRIPILVEITDTGVIAEDTVFIEGSNVIQWNSTETFMLSNKENVLFEVQMPAKLKHGVQFTDNSITISIQDKYTGDIVISAEYDGKLLIKTVTVKTV